MNVMHGNSMAASKRALCSRQEKLGSFRKKPRRRFSPLLLWRLPKADTGSPTVLVDERDARGLQVFGAQKPHPISKS
jgi:hypothetical protein